MARLQILIRSPKGLFAPAAPGMRFTKRMKKRLLLLLVLPLFAAAGLAHAQVARQDVSVSYAAPIPPYISGNAVHLHATVGRGVLISYRYLLTPSSGLELNYGYAQQVEHYTNPTNNNTIHTRFQEISGAYVRNLYFGNWNPFAEVGIGGFIYTPIDDSKTTTQNLSQNTNVGLLYGVGFAYEISPSFDIRAEYRGLVLKTPTFSVTNFSTGRYFNINEPVVGVAYHF